MRTKAELTWLANKKRAERRRAVGKGLILGIAMGTPAVWFAVSDQRTQQPSPQEVTNTSIAKSPIWTGSAAEENEDIPRSPSSPRSPTTHTPNGVPFELLSAMLDLQGTDPTARARAIWILGAADLTSSDESLFEELLIRIAQGDTPDDRRVAIDTIGQRAYHDGLVVLRKLLTQDDLDVVANATRAIGAAQYHAARDDLRALLGHKQARVQVEAAIALDLLEDSAGREKLVALALEHRTTESAIKAFRALDRRNDHRIKRIAKDLLASERTSRNLLASACRALGKRRAPVSKAELSRALELEPEYQLSAHYALAADGHSSSLSALLQTAKDVDGDLADRVTASVILLKLDSPKFRQIIGSWLNGPRDTSYRDQMTEILESESWEID